MNKVFLSGNLTRDPEIKRTPNGKAYTRIGIAVQRRFKNPNTGQYDVDFFTLVAWERTAEFIGRYLRKGSRILVEGSLRTSNYEKDGVKHYNTEIWVDNIEFAGAKRTDDSQRGGRDNYGGGYQGGNDDLGGVPVPDDSVPFVDDIPQHPTDDNLPF